MRHFMVAGLVVLAACTVRTGDGDIDIDPATDRIGDWEGTLQERNNSGIRGTATARSAVAAAGASIAIAGATPDSHHPWHVHRGTCGSGGSIVGDAGAYPVLHVGADGNARASANITVGLSEDAEYHVNVHRSPTDLGTIVACGQLRH